MKASNLGRVAWLFFLPIIFSTTANAERLLTATCEKLDGTKLAMVNDRPTSTLQDHLAPIFYIDSEKPKILANEWPGRGRVDKYESIIIHADRELIHAVELSDGGLTSYTLSITDGTVLFSLHRRSSLFDKGVSLLSFAAKCEITGKR